MLNLLEGISSFGYKPPKDPEKLLYDFYFLVGYVYGIDWSKVRVAGLGGDDESKVLNFVFNEAVNDCTINLRQHMLKAVKWSISAELRHVFDQDITVTTLSPDTLKFLTTYRTNLLKYSDSFLKQTEPRVSQKHKAISKDELFGTSRAIYSGSSRHESYAGSYVAIESTQKQLKVSEEDFAKVAQQLFLDPSWATSYGGKAWANIAKAYGRLYTANTTEQRIVWIDHVYDLQHNTGSVFTKVKAYTSNRESKWLAKALDWKRDATDLRGFYDKVSLSLKPVVSWISKNLKDLTIEGLQVNTKKTRSSVVQALVNILESKKSKYIVINMEDSRDPYEIINALKDFPGLVWDTGQQFSNPPDHIVDELYMSKHLLIYPDTDTEGQYRITVSSYVAAAALDSGLATVVDYKDIVAPKPNSNDIQANSNNFVTKLEAGKWYKLVNTSGKPLRSIPGWNTDGLMNFMLDGKPRKVTRKGNAGPFTAAFEVPEEYLLLFKEMYNLPSTTLWTWKIPLKLIASVGFVESHPDEN